MVIKRDFRTLAPATQAELRRIAVAMVRAGKTRVEAAATVGVNRRFVGQWVKVAAQGGEAVLAGRRRGRRPGEQKALSAAQEEGLRYLIARGCPDQFGLSFALWTRQAVRALIAREPRRTAVKSSGPTRPACPVGPITAAALPPEGTPRSSGDRASAFRSR